MIFCFDLGVTPIILTALSLLCFVCVIITYMLRVKRVARYARRQNLELPDFDDHERVPDPALEPASIVVYAQDQADNLSRLLPQLLEQQYAPGFEIIVVNEGESEATRDIVDTLRITHRNLYLTFTPDGARNLSRKKLALMLGIKAARNRVVVNTTATASIPSTHWLETMMRNFTDKSTEIVLGYAVPADTDNALGKHRHAFDTIAAGVTWLTAAIAGKPYRGTEYNIAYTRDIFFRNKGFSRSLNLRHGDDDIFISEIANGQNTAVELSDESVVEIINGNHPRTANDRWARRRFTSRFISHRPRLMPALARWAYLASGLMILVAAALEPRNTFALAIAAGALLLWTLAAAIPWRIALNNLFGRRLATTLPFLAATLPLRRTARSVMAAIRREKRYTWE